jgi:hypothetical protein
MLTPSYKLKGTNEADLYLRGIPETVRRGVVEEFKDGVEEMYRWLVAERLSGGPRSGRTTSLRIARREGNLIRALHRDVIEADDRVTGQVYFEGDEHIEMIARVLQEGATIVPRTAGALTIPIAEEAEGRRARDFGSTFIFRAKSGNAFIAQRQGTGPRPTLRLLFLLARKVVIPPRPVMREAAERFFPQILQNVFRRVRGILQGGG